MVRILRLLWISALALACAVDAPVSVDNPGRDDAPIRTDSLRYTLRFKPAERVGRFRVELMLCKAPVTDSDRCELLPQVQRQSNAFEVVFP